MTLLAIKGIKPHQILVDTVDEHGATLRHLQICASVTHAEQLVQRIMENHANTLFAMCLPSGEYVERRRFD